MSYINRARMLPTRIYQVDNILVVSPKASKVIRYVMGDNTTENFVNIIDKLKFVPNAPKKIAFPNVRINPTTFTQTKSNTERDSKFIELKEFRVPFNNYRCKQDSGSIYW